MRFTGGGRMESPGQEAKTRSSLRYAAVRGSAEKSTGFAVDCNAVSFGTRECWAYVRVIQDMNPPI